MNTLRPLLDLFRHHREKSTGHWRLGQDPGRVVYFDSGDIVFAQSSFPQDRLTQILVERGKLTQAQLDYALGNLKPGMSIGKNLIEMGFITQRDLLEVARLQVERVVAGALGVSGLEPVFEPREELEPSIVRLPMDSAALLLNGLLAIHDRERILELLGPLNQVVVLQGRRLQEMALPSDLSRLPAMLDGTHTLLELSRESGVEPIRLGLFALFLREMGWARLHELPPVDRGALDLALEAEPEQRSLGLPSPIAEGAPSLFSTIQDASRPTTNLEHLSQALDELDDLEESAPQAAESLDDPFLETEAPDSPLDAHGFRVETGQAILPTPAMPLQDAQGLNTRDLDLQLAPTSLEGLPDPDPLPPPLPEEAPSRAPRTFQMALLVIILLCVGAGSFLFWKKSHRTRQAGPSPSAPAVPVVVAPPGKPAASRPAPEPAQASSQAPAPSAAAKPPSEPAPKTPVQATQDTRVEARLEALLRGDLERALKQGAQHRQSLGADLWVLRLEIACMGETLKRAVEFFQPSKPDLFILPLGMRDGRTCYQVYYGKFTTKAEAEAQVATLPVAFREGGNRPRPYRVSEIPERQ